jgi:hypothetical protein
MDDSSTNYDSFMRNYYVWLLLESGAAQQAFGMLTIMSRGGLRKDQIALLASDVTCLLPT